jgi:hypothetical protein
MIRLLARKLCRYGNAHLDAEALHHKRPYRPPANVAANLFFQLVSSRYEHASLILTSNLPFARWGDAFAGPDHRLGDDRQDRPSRRRHQPQRQQLPAQETPTRRHYGTIEPQPRGPIFGWR